jgi:hypothetical protein
LEKKKKIRGKIFLFSWPVMGPTQLYPTGTGESYLGDKVTGAWSWPLTSS